MATLTGISNLGVINKESFSKDSQLFKMPLPRSDSTSSILADLFGATATITISGVFSTAHGTLATMIAQLKALITGTQSARTYVSDVSGTYTVLVDNVKIDYEEGAGANMINYEISLVEGSSVT